MKPLRARVRDGRLVLDEPTTLPEGTALDLVLDDEGDELDEDERRKLDQAIAKSWGSALEGKVRPGSNVLDELRDRR